MEEEKNAYRILVGNPEGMIPVERPGRTWDGNIEMDLKGWVVWTGFIWLRIGTLVNTVIKLTGSIKCWEVLE
jgi:hypothetical protein